MLALLVLVLSPVNQGSVELIARMPPDVQKSFNSISKIIKEKGNNNPTAYEAYIARAQIWAAVGASEESLRDFLVAGELGKKGQWTPADQSRFFRMLQGSLKAIESFPKGKHVSDAQVYYYQGIDAFHQFQFPKSLEFLDSTLILDPNHLEARCFRAILHHKMGHLHLAKKDASIVAQRLSLSSTNASTASELNQIGNSLEKVQGESRNWFTEMITASPIEKAR